MNEDDQEALAAEYALGTLDAQERAQALALIAADPAFAARVAGWERRLGALHDMAEAVEPPAALWDKIAAGLPAGARDVRIAAPAGAEIIDLTRRLRRWRGMAVAAGALAASLALFVSLRDFAPDYLPGMLRPQGSQGQFVAVLQKDAASPGFILTVDLASKSYTVRTVGAEKPADRSYELWLVSDKFPAPRSLGVIGENEFTMRPALAAYDADTINNATYAVTLEPRGGSPTGAATGPIVFAGKLIEATPPAARR
jgi:anti-sigma-K factor RskA